MTAPVAMLTCQMLPDDESAVQNEVPLGSTLMAKSWAPHPGIDEHG